MRFLLVLATSLFALSAHSTTYSESSFRNNDNAAYINLGFHAGGFAFGAEYEKSVARTYGLGGFFRLYQKDEENGVTLTPGYTLFGGYIRPHFHRRAWDLYVSPGIAVIMIDSNDDETTLGPSLNIGLLYQITRDIAIGMEHTKVVVWFSDDNRGTVVDDLLFKGRYSF